MTIDARVYYPTERSLGILCEVVGGFVYEIGSETWRPISLYDGGKFVRLVPETATVKAAKEANDE